MAALFQLCDDLLHNWFKRFPATDWPAFFDSEFQRVGKVGQLFCKVVAKRKCFETRSVAVQAERNKNILNDIARLAVWHEDVNAA